nr:MAG TPA: protein of unknown function (DUF5320) [Caudoviricetes sp.]
MNKYLNEIIDFLNNLKNENDNFFDITSISIKKHTNYNDYIDVEMNLEREMENKKTVFSITTFRINSNFQTGDTLSNSAVKAQFDNKIESFRKYKKSYEEIKTREKEKENLEKELEKIDTEIDAMKNKEFKL